MANPRARRAANLCRPAVALPLAPRVLRLLLFGGAFVASLTLLAFMPKTASAVPMADVAVTQEDTPDPVGRGHDVTYTATIANLGPDTTQVFLVVTLPAGTSKPVLVSSQGSCAPPSDTDSLALCDLGSLPAGSRVVLTTTVTTTDATPHTITNTIETSPTGFDPDFSNNSAVEDTTVVEVTNGDAQADLVVLKGAVPFVGPPGDAFDFCISITNLGPDTAENVILHDALPTGVTLVSTIPGCAIGTSSFTCSLGDLSPDTRVEVRFDAVSSIAGPLINTATLSSDTFDPDTGNNQHQSVVGVQPLATGPTQGADLALIKTASPEQVVVPPAVLAVPPEVTYTVTVTNYGPETASAVQLADIPVSSLTVPMNVLALTSSQGTCVIQDPRTPGESQVLPIFSVDEVHLLCDLGDIPAGTSVTLTLEIETGGPPERMVLNAAHVVSLTPDPYLPNNATLILVPEPQILGDVNGDGLVGFDDRDIVINCADEQTSGNPECDDADVNGDGAINRKDASVVAQRRTALIRSNIATATFKKGTNEQLGALGEWYEYFLLYLRSDGPDQFNKTRALNLFGGLPDVQRVQTTPPAQNAVSGGQFKVFTAIPDGELAGVTGCETCIGVILLPPEGNPLVFHFNGEDDVIETLEAAGPFPKGTRAALCGGNNAEGSNVTLHQVTTFFLDNPQIDVAGYSDTTGLWIDNTGTFFLTNRDAPSNNLP